MQSIPIKVVSIAIIKIHVGIFAIEASAKIKKVVACHFEPSTRQQWYTDYSVGPTPATITKKLVMHY